MKRARFSSEDARFWTVMIALAGLVYTTSQGLNLLPYPYPLIGIISPFLILLLMAVWIFSRVPSKRKHGKQRSPC